MGMGRRRKRKGSVSTPLEIPSNFSAAVVPACETIKLRHYFRCNLLGVSADGGRSAVARRRRRTRPTCE